MLSAAVSGPSLLKDGIQNNQPSAVSLQLPSAVQLCTVSTDMLNSLQLKHIWTGALSQEKMERIWRILKPKILVN